jgi:hypothetical protein
MAWKTIVIARSRRVRIPPGAPSLCSRQMLTPMPGTTTHTTEAAQPDLFYCTASACAPQGGTPTDEREKRSLALSDAATISRNGKGWIVPSQRRDSLHRHPEWRLSPFPVKQERRWEDRRSTLRGALPQHLCPLPRHAQAGYGAGTVRLNLARSTATQISQERRWSVWPSPESTIG